VAVNPGGSTIASLGAAAALQISGADSAAVRAEDLVMSDGPVPAAVDPSLTGHPVAIVIFGVVVNRAAGVHSLTVGQLAGIWNGTYTNWSEVGGADLPIDIVSRNTDSGTRATFDHKILHAQTELGPSSQSCTSKDLNPAIPVIRCEKASTSQLLQTVNEVKGAIGYAEAAEAVAYGNIDVIQLDGRDPTSAAVKNEQYPFWAVEYLYTYGVPQPGSPLSAFIGYMGTDAAASILQSPDWGAIPCGLTALCAT
jgi:phosphate transport system substrate-binding protein